MKKIKKTIKYIYDEKFTELERYYIDLAIYKAIVLFFNTIKHERLTKILIYAFTILVLILLFYAFFYFLFGFNFFLEKMGFEEIVEWEKNNFQLIHDLYTPVE